MLGVVGVIAWVVGWDAWIIRRTMRGVPRTVWLDTASGGIRTINRNHWRRLGLLIGLGALLYHLEAEQELHDLMCPAAKENPTRCL